MNVQSVHIAASCSPILPSCISPRHFSLSPSQKAHMMVMLSMSLCSSMYILNIRALLIMICLAGFTAYRNSTTVAPYLAAVLVHLFATFPTRVGFRGSRLRFPYCYRALAISHSCVSSTGYLCPHSITTTTHSSCLSSFISYSEKYTS